jgi:hypothetical protein
MINATLDLSAVVNAAEVMQATANTLQKIAKNDRSNRLNRSLTEFVFAGLEKNLKTEGSSIFQKNAPHVFEWSEVVDRTSLTPSEAQQFAGSRSSVHDMSNEFKPTIKKSKKLYILKLRKTTSSAYIEFLENSQPAMYDRVIEAKSSSDTKGNWGQHHFKDQATELEKVQVIYKSAAEISKRRTNEVKKPGEPSRIRQASKTRNKILRFEDYQRDNAFHGKFQESWQAFIQMYRNGEHQKSEREANRILGRASGKEVAKASQQSAVATLALTGARGGRLGSAGGVRFIVGPKGGISARFPDPKSSAGTKAKQKSIEKNASVSLNKAANRRRGS